ncbi:MAG: FMN-binding protein [Desulfobacteraceae bacterium]|nr:MAG: FMN-binding protein [Desulfobacteraceae bacterium]
MRERLFSVLYMFLITLCFTSMVSGVKFLNEERIERNQRAKLQRIILTVLDISTDGDRSEEDLVRIFESRVRSIQVQGRTLYAAYQTDGQTLKGYAFPVGGPGFWGPIYGMVAVDEKASKILGISFYKHSETPGLGGRMTEAWFKDQFAGLKLYPLDGNRKIFYLKPAGTQKGPDELDAITGATQTSRAIETFLNQELERFLKEVWISVKKE